MADFPAQLEYARAPRWRGGRRLRWVIIVALVLIVLLGSLKFLGPAWTHVRLLRYQARCMEHADPPGKLVFAWKAPVGGPQVYNLGRQVLEWNQFYSLFSPPGGRSAWTVFVHEMRRTDGARRLVEVDLFGATGEMTTPRLDSTVIEPGSLFSRPQLRGGGSWYTPFQSVSDRRALQLFAGQADPADASHFTIAFKYGERGGTIDGWLRDDDGVLFELRDTLPAVDRTPN